MMAKLQFSVIVIIYGLLGLVYGQNSFVRMDLQNSDDDCFFKLNEMVSGTVYIEMSQSDFSAYRFSINADQSAKLDSAYLEITFNWGEAPAAFLIFIEDSVNSAPLDDNLNNRKLLPIRRPWSIPKVTGSYGQKFTSPDIYYLIKTIMEKDGWKAGNYITLVLKTISPKPAKPFEIVSFEGAQSMAVYNGAKLFVKGTGFQGIKDKNIWTPKPPVQNLKSVDQKPKLPQSLPSSATPAVIPKPPVVSPQVKKQILPLAPLQECPAPKSVKNKEKIPIILVIDDLQVDYLESVAIAIVNTTIFMGVDVLLNVIPNNIKLSRTLLPYLQEWYKNYQCQVEIGEHGFTHQGIQYSMPTLQMEGQEEIIGKGKSAFEEVGILVREFTPPGGDQNDDTLKALSGLGFHTDIDWWKGLPENHGISIMQVIRLCDMKKGSELGAGCKFKTQKQLLEEVQKTAKLRGYVSIGYHVQDFITPSYQLNPSKLVQYMGLINALKKTKKYEFITPEQFCNK